MAIQGASGDRTLGSVREPAVLSHVLQRTALHGGSTADLSSRAGSVAGGDLPGLDSPSVAASSTVGETRTSPPAECFAAPPQERSPKSATTERPPELPLPSELSPEFFEEQSARIMAAIAGVFAITVFVRIWL